MRGRGISTNELFVSLRRGAVCLDWGDDAPDCIVVRDPCGSVRMVEII